MSFILDAIKKSDRKRNEARAAELDPAHPRDLPATRRPRWRWLLLAVVLVNGALLVWFLAGDRSTPTVTSTSPPPENQLAVVPPTTGRAAEPLPGQASAEPPRTESSSSGGIPLFGARIYTIAELPAAVQRRIPDLHMSLHAYSKEDVAGRMVRVNGQILRQGGLLEGRFLLEEIRADGAVFRYEGYRFLLPRRS